MFESDCKGQQNSNDQSELGYHWVFPFIRCQDQQAH